MRVFALAAFLIAAPLVAAAPAAAQSHTTPGPVKMVDYGIYTLSVDRRVPAPDDISKERNVVSNIRLKNPGYEIDAQLAKSFGYRFRITDPALVGKTLTLRTRFPPMTNPETKETATVQDRPFSVSSTAEEVYDGYRFDYDWEMVEGTWTFQVLDGDRLLAEIKFKVVIAIN
jgi:hypothetical protein